MYTTLSKFIIVIIIAFSAISFSGCFSSSNGIPYYAISDEFAGYCWFQEGSYWIYQNDSTLVNDSILITEVREHKRFNPESIDYNYQAVEMFTNTNNFNVAHHELTAGSFEVEPGEMNSLLRIYFNDGTYQLIFSPEYPLGEEIILGDELGNYTNVEIIDEYQLNGNTYNQVYHTRIVVSVAANIEYNYWIAKNYSLIKSVTNNNGQVTSLSLLSGNMIPHTN
jgi:hypothetical protein